MRFALNCYILNDYFIVEKVVSSISLQSKIDPLTAKPPSYDKPETLTDLNPGQEDWKLPSSDLISKNLPELRESQNLNKPPLGMAEEIRLHNVMKKVQNMPLEYDASRAHRRQNWNDQIIVNEDYRKPTSRPRENWNDQGNSIDIVNEDYMKPAASEERLEKIPMEINTLPRSPPAKDVSDKEKVKSSFSLKSVSPLTNSLSCLRMWPNFPQL